MKICSVEGCGEKRLAKNLCKKHYSRQSCKRYREKHSKQKLAYQAQYRKKNKERLEPLTKQYLSSDAGRFFQTKSKAKTRKLEFSLTLEQFKVISNKPCFYCANELCGKEEFQGGHLDRINNSKGYTLDNVLSCGIICNKIRLDVLTVEETFDAVQGILAGRKRRQQTKSE